MAVQFEPTEPIIIWVNYGVEGWKPKSYPSLRQALVDTRYSSDFVVTRLVQFDVVEVCADNGKLKDRHASRRE